MRRSGIGRGILVGAALVATGFWCGCNNDQGAAPGPGPGPGPGPAGPVTIAGRVVNATSLNTGIAGATVEALGFGLTDLTGFDGSFRLVGLPFGSVNLNVEFPVDPSLRPQDITVNLDQAILDATQPVFTVTIAALPVVEGAPTQVQIIPNRRTVGLGTQSTFTAQVLVGGGSPISVAPTWTATGSIGTVDEHGVFAALRGGTGSLIAQSGTAVGFATVTVVVGGAPTIGSVAVAPQTLPVTGGGVNISTFVQDPDGLSTVPIPTPPPPLTLPIPLKGKVVAQVRLLPEVWKDPKNDPGLVPLTFQGTSPVPAVVTQGTWVGTYQAKGNSNSVAADGSQEPQIYEVRIVAQDLSGPDEANDNNRAFSTPVPFQVRGAEPPPPVP